jgi:hypothetical protein
MKKIIFIEGNIRRDLDEIEILPLQSRLHRHLSQKDLTYELLEDILADERSGRHRLGTDYDEFRNILLCLRVVEYSGPSTEVTCYSSNEVEVKVQLYLLHDTVRRIQEDREIPHTEITPMPHVRFSGVWDE